VTVGLSVAIAGCSLVGVGYDWLPSLAMWRADGYVSLTPEQRALAQRRIGDLHAWHRATQLDDYLAFLRGVQRRVATGEVDEAQIRAWRLEAFERWKPIAERAAPGVAEVALTLEPHQVQRMRAEIARDNDKVRRKWLPADPAQRVEARYKRYVERAETFLGPLTDPQRQLARRMAAEAPPTEDAWFAQRLARQQDLLALMERLRTERPSEETASRWMRDHLMRYAPARDGPDRASTESSLAAGDAMSAAMLASATPKQRQHLERKLQEWVEMVEGLRPAQTAQTPATAR